MDDYDPLAKAFFKKVLSRRLDVAVDMRPSPHFRTGSTVVRFYPDASMIMGVFSFYFCHGKLLYADVSETTLFMKKSWQDADALVGIALRQLERVRTAQEVTA